jgi:pyrroloquinoline quinone (PQQ) biosynthesis protein C
MWNGLNVNATKSFAVEALPPAGPFQQSLNDPFDLNALRPLLDAHPVTNHPFLVYFREARWTRAQVRFWAEQQFYFSISLPSAFAAIYARAPDRCWKEKRELVKLLSVEAWGLDDFRCHSHYFIELCRFLDLDIAQLTQQRPRPYTEAYLQLRLAICLDAVRPVSQGLAAIAIGNEILNLYVYRAYRDGIHKIRGCEDCPTGYFDAHLNDEEADAEIFAKLFAAVVSSESDFDAAQAGLLELLDGRVTFLDALCDDLRSVDKS